jgi:hypothetical protein
VARDEPAARTVMPWELRLGFLLPLPPFAVGAAIAALLIAGYAAVQMSSAGSGAMGAFPPEGRDSIVAALALGFVVAGFHYTFVGTGRDLRELARCHPAIARALRTRPTPLLQAAVVRASRVAGAIGLAMGLGVLGWIHSLSVGGPGSGAWRPAWLWTQGLVLVLFWVLGRAAYFTVVGARYAAGFAPEQVDLLDLGYLDLFGRLGLRLSLVWIVGLSIFSLLTLFKPTLESGSTLAPVLAVTLVVALLALVLPVRRVHARIQQTKRAALASLAGELRHVRDATLAGDKTVQGRLADLLAYEARIAAIREWPFDTSVRVRFLFFLLIPFGSWLAGALVERLVDKILG